MGRKVFVSYKYKDNDVKEEDLHLQEEETDGHMFATLNQIKEFAAQGKFLHYDSIQAAFENL